MFNGLIEQIWVTSINSPTAYDAENVDNEFEEYKYDDEATHIVPDIDYTVNTHGRLSKQQPTYDKILHSEVSIQLGEEIPVGKVTKHKIVLNSTVAGNYDENAYIPLMIYEVEFPDRKIKDYATNII